MKKFLLACHTTIFLLQPLQGLELKRVILSTNNDPMYIQFWPVVAKLWQAMGLRPTLALVAHEDCTIDTSLGDVIRFDPLPDLPESLQAQALRLMLPTLFPNDGCLIADIDMLPVSYTYFREGAAKAPNRAFVVYRNKAYQEHKWPMCYVAARGNVFKSIFGVSKIEEFPALLRTMAAAGFGWNTDEIMMYRYVKKWEKANKGSVVRLGHRVGPRLDRSTWENQMQTFQATPSLISNYIDCHCPRPYADYRDSIDSIVEAVLNEWKLVKK